MTDSIADMLTRIRNAQAVSKETVVIPFSNLKYEIAKILEKNNYIGKVDRKGRKEKKFIEITLKYQEDEFHRGLKKPVISGLKRISRPGQRIYIGSKNIKLARVGYGMQIVSTSQGLMTGKEAKRKKLGGEILCEIW